MVHHGPRHHHHGPRHHHHGPRHHHHHGPLWWNGGWNNGWNNNWNGRPRRVYSQRSSMLGTILGIFLFLVVLGIMITIFYFSFRKDGFTKKLPQKLTEKGWTFYGMDGCGWCQKQKKDFGKDFIHIDYVNCEDPENQEICSSFTGFPTWRNKYTGEKKIGYQSLKDLSTGVK